MSIDLHAAGQAVGRVHRDCADAVVAEVLLDLADERPALVVALDRDRVVDLRQRVRERHFDHDALDLLDPADLLPSVVSSGRSAVLASI